MKKFKENPMAITEEDKVARDQLITSLLIDFYFNRCEGIKLEEYYGE